MMRKKAFFLLIIILLALPSFNIPQLAEVEAEPPEAGGSVIGTFTPTPFVCTETDDYIMLNESWGFAFEFRKGSQGYNKIYNASGEVVVYAERHYLEYWRSQGAGSWNVRGIPYNLTYVKVSDWYYNVTRHYTDYIRTDWNITFVIKSGKPLKTVIMVDSGQTDTYRLSWQLSGITFDYNITIEDHGVDFGAGRLGVYWDDVYENFGDITTSSVESHAQGRKLTVNFVVGEIAADNSLVLDPMIDTTTGTVGTGNNYQRKIIYDGTYWWFFYSNGTTNGYQYSYSSDPTSSFTFGGTVQSGVAHGGRTGGIAVAFNGTNGVLANYAYYSSNYKFRHNLGSISGTTITWEGSDNVITDNSYFVGVTNFWDASAGFFRAGLQKYNGGGDVNRYKSTDWTQNIIDTTESIDSSNGGFSMVDLGANHLNILQNGNEALRWSLNSNDFSGTGLETVPGGHASFSVVSQGSIAHIVYLTTDYDFEYSRFNGTAWSVEETILSGGGDARAYPVISLDAENDDLYVIWGNQTTDEILYRKRDSTGVSGTWDSSSTVLADESARGLKDNDKHGNGRISAPLTFNNSILPVMYMTNSSAPCEIHVATITLNADPTITSATGTDLKDTDNMYGMDGYYTFTVVVNDADGATDIDKVYLQAKSDETVRWEVRATSLTGTPAYSIQTGDTIIDQSGSGWAEDGNAGTATFEVRAEFDHPGLADLDLEVYVEDSEGASAGWTEMQTDYFDVINRMVITNLAASDSRQNAGGTVTISGNIRYATTVSGDTASSYYPADGLFTGIDIHNPAHGNEANDLTIVDGAFTSGAVTLSSSVTSTNYHVYLNLAPDFTDRDSDDGDTVAVITDKVKVTNSRAKTDPGGDVDYRVNINQDMTIQYEMRYEYDNQLVSDGTMTINGISASYIMDAGWGKFCWDADDSGSASVTSRTYDTVVPSGNTHGITVVNLNSKEKTIIWDRVQVSASSVSDARTNIDELEYFECTLIYDYDDSLVTDGTVVIEGGGAAHQGSGVWRLNHQKDIIMQQPYNTIVPSGNAHGITSVDYNGLDDKTITWDRMESHTWAANDTNVDISGGVELRMQMRYDYDNELFDGTDGSISGWTWDGGNGWWEKEITASAGSQSTNYDESDIGVVTDSNYGITAVKNTAGINIITDFIEFHIVQLQDSRIDVSGASEVNYVLRYYYYAQEITDSDASIVGYTYDGVNSWWEKAITGPASVTSTNYDEKDIGAITDLNYGLTVLEDVGGVNLITDRIEIYYEAVDDSIVLKDENIEYRVKARLEYDNHELGSSDSITANSGAMAWDAGSGWYDDQRTQALVGSYEFDTTAASEATYGISVLYEPQAAPTGYWKDDPAIDSAVSDATFDVAVDGWVNITVTDEDLVANFYYVEIQVTTAGAETFTLRWTQSSGIFSEESDASGVCTLNAGGSARVNVDSDTDKIAFKFKVSAGAMTGNVSVDATVVDDDGYSDGPTTYTNEFAINWYGEITVDDSTHSWTGLSPGDSDQTLAGDGDIDVTVTCNDAFDIQVKGNGAITSGGNSIALSNVKVHASTLGSAASMTNSYVDCGGLTSQARGLSLSKSFKLWITVPSPQQDGSYTYTLYVQIQP